MGRNRASDERPGAAPPEEPRHVPLWRREWFLVAVILLVAAGLRTWHLLETKANDPHFFHPSVDPLVYHDWAREIASGVIVRERPFHMGPLYPYLLGGVYAVTGPSFVAARLVQMAIGLGSLLLVYLLTRRVFGRRAALIAGLLSALYPMYVFYENLLLLATLAVFTNLLCAFFLVAARERPRLWRWLAAGAFLGLSALARPNVLPLLPIVLVWMLVELRRNQGLAWLRTALSMAAFALGTALAISPATIHNYAASGRFVLITSAGGMTFYIGNRPDANGSWTVPSFLPAGKGDHPDEMGEAFRKAAERELGHPIEQAEVSRYWTRKAVEGIREDPMRWVRLLVRKLGLVLNHHELPGNRDYYSSRRYSAVLRLPLPSTGAILPFALLGLALAIPAFRRAFPLYALLFVHVSSLVLFFVLSRYRIPAMPLFLSFAGYAVHRLLGMFAAWDLKGVLLSAAGLAAAFGVVHLDLMGPQGETYMHHYNLGNTYRKAGRYEEAVREYRRTIALNPGYVSAHNNLAMLLEVNPSTRAQAVRHWKVVLDFARTHDDAKVVERAERHLERLRQQGFR